MIVTRSGRKMPEQGCRNIVLNQCTGRESIRKQVNSGGGNSPGRAPYGVRCRNICRCHARRRQLGVFRVAVQAARDAQRVTCRSAVGALLRPVLGGAILLNKYSGSGAAPRCGCCPAPKNQFGDACLDILQQRFPRRRPYIFIGLFQVVRLQRASVGVGIHRERHARECCIFNLFHGCPGVSGCWYTDALPLIGCSADTAEVAV